MIGIRHSCITLAFTTLSVAMAGCNSSIFPGSSSSTRPVPEPVNLMLPKSISIHPFTAFRSFDETGGENGIDARIEAKDAAGDTTKAYGNFRFELYAFIPVSADPKGAKLATWDVPLSDAKTSSLHWDGITRAYTFKLRWDQPIPQGAQFVLVAIFSSPFTERLFSERVLIPGQ